MPPVAHRRHSPPSASRLPILTDGNARLSQVARSARTAQRWIVSGTKSSSARDSPSGDPSACPWSGQG
eukprot:6727183-Pyramimonas_sp.AAC.1